VDAAIVVDRVAFFAAADKHFISAAVKVPFPPRCSLPSWWKRRGALQGESLGGR
jgi:hypothetical protein